MSRAQACAMEGRAATSWPHPTAGCRREGDPDQVSDSLSPAGNAGVPARRMMQKRCESPRRVAHITRDMRRGRNFHLVLRLGGLPISNSGHFLTALLQNCKCDPYSYCMCFLAHKE